MKTITFYSYKGGVGRTLALANIAKRLSEFGKKVCLIDFDLEAPGLHHKFKEYFNEKGINNGIVDYINYFSCKNSTPKSIKDYITQINFKNDKFRNIDFISAGNIYSEKYWKTLFSIDWIKLFYEKDSQGVALFTDLKERIKRELKPDYLLIDSRTGISEISGITMSILADEIVLLTVKNDENIQGLKYIIKALSKPENTLLGNLPKLNFVLCRIPYFEKPYEKNIEKSAIDEVERDFKEYISKNKLPINLNKLLVIHSDPILEIEEKLLIGYKFEREYERFEKNILSSRKKIRIKTPIASDYLDLFEELTKDKLTNKEKLIFDEIKKSEYLIERAQNTIDNKNKIDLLMEAIKLNKKSDEAYSLLAKVYRSKGDYDIALKNIEKAISLNSESNEYLCLKGYILRKITNIKEAKSIFELVLKRDNKNLNALHFLGNVYYENKMYKKALKYYLKMVEFHPDYYGGYNDLGNVYRVIGDYKNAFKFIYKALELDPQDPFSNGTLAEIYGQLKNKSEFYKNFELSLSLGMSKFDLERIINNENVYKPFLKESKFINLLKKYNIDIDISEVKK
jgi:tetratricopeptide (TPR) repeat protein